MFDVTVRLKLIFSLVSCWLLSADLSSDVPPVHKQVRILSASAAFAAGSQDCHPGFFRAGLRNGSGLVGSYRAIFFFVCALAAALLPQLLLLVLRH